MFKLKYQIIYIYCRLNVSKILEANLMIWPNNNNNKYIKTKENK